MGRENNNRFVCRGGSWEDRDDCWPWSLRCGECEGAPATGGWMENPEKSNFSQQKLPPLVSLSM